MSNPILINGEWRQADASATTFSPHNPSTGEVIAELYPVATLAEISELLDAGLAAAHELRALPVSRVADFLNGYADAIEAAKDELAQIASAETGLPASPRLDTVEIPRTFGQLRQFVVTL